ncbi:MAG: ABC transporter ATP-binding protein [Coprothermobacter proteolyticus]
MSDEKRPTSETQPRGMMGQGGRRGMMPGEKPKDFSGTVKRLLAYFKPEMIGLIIVVILTITSVVFTVYAPRILGNATNELFKGIISKQLPPGVTKDQVIAMLKARGQDQFAEMISNMDLVPGAGVDFAAIGKILLTLAVIYLLAALFQWLQQYIMAGVSQRTVYRLRRDVDQKLQRLPLKYYDSHPHGDILSRVTNDVDNIAHTLQQTITQMLSSIVTVIGVLIMMFKISTLLSWISLAVIPVSLVITLLIARQSQKQFIRQWNSTGAVNAHVEEMFTGHNLVKAFNREKDVLERFRQQNEKLYESSFKAQFISGLIHPVINFVNNLNYVAIAVLGGVNVANGVISLGDVQAFIQYSRQFTQPIVQVASIMNVLQSTVASAERVFELLDEEEEVPDVDNPVVLEDVKGNVRFEHVYFSYDPNVPLIEDFNLDVPAGDMIAIVGPTGAGKTTLVNLLMRFYDVNSGRITIDGVDIKQMRRRDLRKIFGMVLQDTWLFSGTIRDNIAYGKENATEEEIIAAAKAAYVDHFVRTLPDGYDTVLTGDATNISQGQRQLITIARAFLADPKILILDEATSSVDTRTEMLIQKAMQNLMKGRTSFVIAHRLSTIREADNIVVMDHGRIVEQGNHKQLMEKKGFYYNLYMSQFMGALVDEAM